MAADPTLLLVTGPPGTGKSTVAEWAAGLLGAAVLSHDWAMSGLRPYPELQAALDAMEPPGHRAVGWSLLGALAREQLVAGRPVVLDGVARATEVDRCRALAAAAGVTLVLVVTRCRDAATHRRRLEGRRRAIPDWYELTWEHVAASLATWAEPPGADLVLDACEPPQVNQRRLAALLAPLSR